MKLRRMWPVSWEWSTTVEKAYYRHPRVSTCDGSYSEVSRRCTVVPACGVDQATFSAGSLDITSKSDMGSDRVTDRCGIARLGGQVCPREVWHTCPKSELQRRTIGSSTGPRRHLSSITWQSLDFVGPCPSLAKTSVAPTKTESEFAVCTVHV